MLKQIRVALALTLVHDLASAHQSHQSSPVLSATVSGKILQIALRNGQTETINLPSGQTSFGTVQIAPDHRTVGWVTNETPYDGYDANLFAGAPDLAARLTIWKSGAVQHVFTAGIDGILTWKFVAGGRQVAFHNGPMHLDQDPLCELHDALTGRRLATWHPASHHQEPPWATGLWN